MLHALPRIGFPQRVAIVALLAAATSGFAGERDVQFIVLAPPGVVTEKMFVSLSTESWPEGGRELRSLGDGLFGVTLKFAPGANVEYKFLHGTSWAQVEKSPGGEELGNRNFIVPNDDAPLVVFNEIARWADQEKAERREVRVSVMSKQPNDTGGATRESVVTGKIEVLEDVSSPQLGNKRNIYVRLPDGYDPKSNDRYPVLYMHDGQNLFDAKLSTAGIEWGIDEAATALEKVGRMRKTIIVGIANTKDRMKEYSPYPDKTFGGDADKYLAFLLETVKPEIDKKYNTLPDRENTAIAGSSMGGLVSLYAITKYPDKFVAAGVISPSLWWAKGKILETTSATEFKKPLRLWVDIGANEGTKETPNADANKPVMDCRELVKILKSKNMTEGAEYMYAEIPNGMHNETAWAARAERFLAFLMPPKGASQ